MIVFSYIKNRTAKSSAENGTSYPATTSLKARPLDLPYVFDIVFNYEIDVLFRCKDNKFL